MGSTIEPSSGSTVSPPTPTPRGGLPHSCPGQRLRGEMPRHRDLPQPDDLAITWSWNPLPPTGMGTGKAFRLPGAPLAGPQVVTKLNDDGMPTSLLPMSNHGDAPCENLEAKPASRSTLAPGENRRVEFDTRTHEALHRESGTLVAALWGANSMPELTLTAVHLARPRAPSGSVRSSELIETSRPLFHQRRAPGHSRRGLGTDLLQRRDILMISPLECAAMNQIRSGSRA